MSHTYHATGELIDAQTLKLDQPLPAPTGKVRVTVETMSEQVRPDLKEYMEQIWEAQRRRGHVSRTKEEIDAYLNAERDSWDF